MSKIAAELAKATGVDLSKFKDRAELHLALVKGVNALADKDWEKLSVAAQDWANDGADAVKAKKDIPEFPDYTPETTGSSRRRAADPEPEPETAAGAETAVEDLEEGLRVKITFKKRGTEKSATGEVIEFSKRKSFLVVKEADGTEVEIDFDTVTTTEVFHGTAGADDDADEPAEVAVGAVVKFTTKRGKEVEGEVTEYDEKKGYIVVGDADYDLDRIDGDIEIVKAAGSKGRAEPEPEPETTSRRRSSSDDDGKGKGGKDAGAEEEKKRSSNPRGVSVGGRIRELLAEDPDMSADEIGKVLKKEKIEFRDTSLNMIYKDATALIALLRESGQMKKAK